MQGYFVGLGVLIWPALKTPGPIIINEITIHACTLQSSRLTSISCVSITM